jgi:orotidine-5'-phosphate decarboxylase
MTSGSIGRSQTAEDTLIVALDVPSHNQALRLAQSLQGICRWVKVGLELYLAAGEAVVHDLTKIGFSVFLDLKFHDIPNTVAGAVRSAGSLGASLLTVHASGGPAMLSAAAEAAAALPKPPRLLAVTVLTSMDAEQLRATGVEAAPAAQVARLADLAMASGISGLVCSPQETAGLRRRFDSRTYLVTPGIRPAGAAADDQKRAATPAAAITAGADMLVVGRPITAAPDPAAAAQAILTEIRSTLESR